MLDSSWFLILWIIIIITSLSPVTGLFIHGFLLHDISVCCHCHIYQHACFLFFVCNYYYYYSERKLSCSNLILLVLNYMVFQLIIYIYFVLCSYHFCLLSLMCRMFCCFCNWLLTWHINPYPTAFPYGNGMVLHFYQQQESSTTKTVHKVINKGLKTYV